MVGLWWGQVDGHAVSKLMGYFMEKQGSFNYTSKN